MNKIKRLAVGFSILCLAIVALTPAVISSTGRAPPTQAIGAAGSPRGANSSATVSSLANHTLAFAKESGWNLSIEADVTFPLSAVGTVVDPSGQAHSMKIQDLASGIVRLTFAASASDPAGYYKMTVVVKSTSSTSPLQVYTWGSARPAPVPVP